MRDHDEMLGEMIRLMDSGVIKPSQIASLLKIDRARVSEMKVGKRRIQQREMPVLDNFLRRVSSTDESSSKEESETIVDYVPVEILPTFAGMGGGGTGDGDKATALIPRVLVEDMLRGRAGDFVLINVRGDSMEPDFRHGDQLLVDKRDTSPAQPGPFALWDGEWGEYVVKNIERLPDGHVRMFSTNTKYSPSEIRHEQTRIIGRPVWFGRRL